MRIFGDAKSTIHRVHFGGGEFQLFGRPESAFRAGEETPRPWLRSNFD